MTKSFATAALLRLRDTGVVDLDSKLSDIAPHLPLADLFAYASLRDLIAMRLDLTVDDPWADRLLGASNEQLDPFFAMPLIQAGLGTSQCAYSNLSYLLLGRIIAHVSKRPAMDYITDEIIKPLNLQDTMWNPSDECEQRIAFGYRVDCNPRLTDSYFACCSDGAVFAGLWSTVDDLAIWLEFLRAAPGNSTAWDLVLSRASRHELFGSYSHYPVEPMTSLITGQPLCIKADYGFGLVRSRLDGAEYISHSGGIPGYGSHMRVHISSGFGVIALGNGTYCKAALPCTSALHYLVTSLDADLPQIAKRVRDVGARVAEFICDGAVDSEDHLFSYNFWLDNLKENFKREADERLCELGDTIRVEAIRSFSGCQGEIVFAGSKGTKKLEFRLAPHLPARVQSITWVP
jgi:CubicO group peptidase (beta-lactamase class C family)